MLYHQIHHWLRVAEAEVKFLIIGHLLLAESIADTSRSVGSGPGVCSQALWQQCHPSLHLSRGLWHTRVVSFFFHLLCWFGLQIMTVYVINGNINYLKIQYFLYWNGILCGVIKNDLGKLLAVISIEVIFSPLFQTSRDLACFIQFENVNIYYGVQCKMKYKAPTDHCFVLKVCREKPWI